MNSIKDIERRKLEIKQEIAASKNALLSSLDFASPLNEKLGISAGKRMSNNFFDKPSNWLYVASGALILVAVRRKWKFAYDLLPVAARYIIPMFTKGGR